MMSSNDSYLPPPPQTGRTTTSTDHTDDHNGLWSQLLAVFRDLSGAFDPFANDANAEVRALGRIARQRRLQQANDYMVLGDLCARLTLQGAHLSSTYAAKAIAAYTRSAEISQAEVRGARLALVAFARWVADVVRVLDDYESLKLGALLCERVLQISFVAQSQADARRLRALAALLRERMDHTLAEEPSAAPIELVAAERESELLCDQGQILLRQSHAVEALKIFDHALRLNRENHVAWLWRAMALTDLGRFEDALDSYDHALALEPETARIWNSKGALLMEIGRVEQALECFNHALDLPDDVGVLAAVFWLNKGKALFRLGRYHAAHDALVRSHQIDPSAESAAGIAACCKHFSDLESSEALDVI